MNRAILAEGGTVMQFVGDAVMAVFGAPVPKHDHADRAVAAATAMHAAQDRVNQRWRAEGIEPFGLGIGLSTGEVAAALVGFGGACWSTLSWATRSTCRSGSSSVPSRGKPW